MDRRFASRLRDHPHWAPYRRAVSAVLIALLLGMASSPVPGSDAWRPLPDELRLVILVPDGIAMADDLLGASAHEAQLAVTWLESQTGGRLRGDVSHAALIRPALTAELRGPADRAALSVLARVRRDYPDRDMLPIVITPLRTREMADGRLPCGIGGPKGIVLFLGNCSSVPSTATAEFGAGVNRSIAHELVHAMGVVGVCPAGGDGGGHVTDDPADLMFQFALPRTPSQHLDLGNDDYWRHDDPNCPDMADSPLWLIPPPPALPALG